MFDREYHAPERRRNGRRRQVECHGDLTSEGFTRKGLITNLSREGARIHSSTNLAVGSDAQVRIYQIGDAQAIERNAVVRWFRDKEWIGVEFQSRLARSDVVDSWVRRNWYRIMDFLRSDTIRGLEVVLGVIGIWVIVHQTNHIRENGRLQTYLNLVESERFVNELLIEHEELQTILTEPPVTEEVRDVREAQEPQAQKTSAETRFADGINDVPDSEVDPAALPYTSDHQTVNVKNSVSENPTDVDRMILAYVFLNEFKKMYWFWEHEYLEPKQWCNYQKLIARQSKMPAIDKLLQEEGATFAGFNNDFIAMVRRLSKMEPEEVNCEASP